MPAAAAREIDVTLQVTTSKPNASPPMNRCTVAGLPTKLQRPPEAHAEPNAVPGAQEGNASID